ncbi:TRAP transporter large permease subunit [Paraburkholderia kirstenboschensis]|uniref:TRAP transporter large permease subunit n=2 Tax=Paraburkholderia kirstenboschensis TaxID=1245436 RepID=A0ABZ0EBZ2_9BURK|nr:TRAP transporter large permease subunit [Paraburkholderia kirstenboschensis]WOD14748.1 TRAP transporter large permease subunit [Paraburkholderia kirstenboschensis]
MKSHMTQTAPFRAPADNIAARIEGALVWAVEAAAALLVLAEVVLLFSGVVSRYALHRPLDWSDELASLLFLWLAMLGSVIAFWRGHHMRMTALVDRVSATTRAFFDVLAIAASLAFLLLILAPAFGYAYHEADVSTPVLELSSMWRAAAMPAGAALMTLSALLKLARVANWRATLAAVMMVVAIGVVLAVAHPLLARLGNYNLVIFFIGIVTLTVLAGVPIAFAFGLATFSYLALTTSVPLTVVVSRMDEGMSHVMLLAVPLFVFVGQLMEMTGIARAMVAFLANLLGHVRGGLSYVLIGAMYLLSGISGSKAADMAAVAPVLFPEMQKRGSDPGDLTALLAATGAQTETVPPGIVLITIGSVTGVSITALFTGGLLPAVTLGLALCVVVWFRSRREQVQAARPAWSVIGRSLVIALPALLLPVVIRTAVVEGVATATEVSTIGVVYAVAVGLVIYRRFEWRRLKAMLVDTAALSGSILFIIGTATGMAWALTQSGFSQDLADVMSHLPGGAATFMVVSVAAFIVLGSVLEGIPAIVLFGPLLFPVARTLGINEVQYAMVVVLAMGVGLFAPPFGVGYYMACAIGRVDPSLAMRRIWGYLAALIVGLALVAAVPSVSTAFL